MSADERNVALVVLYQMFRASWLRHGDCMRKEDRQSEHERMVQLSDVINMIEKKTP